MFGRKKVNIPEWASILGQKEYGKFISAVNEYFKNQGKPYNINIADGAVILTENNRQFGLSNLAQLCTRIKPEEYPHLIKYHFGLMEEHNTFRETLLFEGFESISQYLALRLHDKEYTDIKEDTIRRHFAGEVYAVLVYDFPNVIENIPQNHTEKWNKSEDELFAIAAQNVRKNYELPIKEIKLDKAEFFAVETEHFFAPNILFEIEHHEALLGKSGAIIGIPTRSLAMICPINDLSIVNALNIFFANISTLYDNGPGSLTREIYWYHNGQYEALNYTVGESIGFKPSEAFLEVLNGLEEKV